MFPFKTFIQVKEEIRKGQPELAHAPREQWDAYDPTLISEGLFAAANIFTSVHCRSPSVGWSLTSLSFSSSLCSSVSPTRVESTNSTGTTPRREVETAPTARRSTPCRSARPSAIAQLPSESSCHCYVAGE